MWRRGPVRVAHDGWEHAKLSPLSPRTEIFPGSQNSKPTGEALSESDAARGGALTIFGGVTVPVQARQAGRQARGRAGGEARGRKATGSGGSSERFSRTRHEKRSTFSSCLGHKIWEMHHHHHHHHHHYQGDADFFIRQKGVSSVQFITAAAAAAVF
uniref:transcription factor GATA-6-like n=1 Tax=Solea senegalensis TaxID=28829 RepID=UPI001CD84F6C|nr:transcription factor GATA-6-like [Solea senegalensis]